MQKEVISNVPRKEYAKRLLSSHDLSYTETIINKTSDWNINKKLESVSKFIKLDNNTTYKEAEVFLIFRNKALDYIKDYTLLHKDEMASFFGQEFIKENHLESFFDEDQYHASTNPIQIDYKDKASRKGLEKKWDALQTIWSTYISTNKQDNILIPKENLSIKDRSVYEIDGIVKGLQKDGCFKQWHRGTKNYAIDGINHTTLEKTYMQTKHIYEIPIHTSKKQEQVDNTQTELICENLHINLTQGTICYANNNVIEISPDNKIVKFLIILIENRRVVEYVEIAKKLEMNCWHEEVKNKDVARDIQFLKRDTVTFLKNKVGMTNGNIRKIIISKKNIGYKMHCA